MEGMKVSVVYEIKENDSWRGSEGIKIVSNIATDETVGCEIAKSLVDYLKKESAMLEPDKLLLNLAEAQKRGIQDNLEALDDFEITAKTRSDKVHAKLLKSYEDIEGKYEELQTKFLETSDKFCNTITKSKEKIDKELEYLGDVQQKLMNIDSYSLERLSTTLEKILALCETDSEIMKLVLNHKA